MEVWAIEVFENDYALDFLLDDKDNMADKIPNVLNAVSAAAQTGIISVKTACIGLAVAEIVAAAFGKPSMYLNPADLENSLDDDFLYPATQDRADIIKFDCIAEQSLRAVDLITVGSEKSELYKMFEKYGLKDKWLGMIQGLRGRLKEAAS